MNREEEMSTNEKENTESVVNKDRGCHMTRSFTFMLRSLYDH